MNTGRATPLLEVHDLRVHYPLPRPVLTPWARAEVVRAVDGVSLQLDAGETLGVVGESGCGKSTLARALLGLPPAGARQTIRGEVRWRGEPLPVGNMQGAAVRALRREAQMVFQDPLASLNPRMTVHDIIAEPLRTHRPALDAAERGRLVAAMMERVGLAPRLARRYPHEFSGGQCQRIGIARALVLGPQWLVCDEPVSALDVSVQAQIINLLMELQRESKVAMLFIAHDLAVVRQVSQRVMVMYLGKVVEIADRDALYATARHPYTRALLSAIAVPDPARERHKKIDLLPGDLPSPLDPPSGCAFRTRCPKATDRCAAEAPALRDMGASHQVACHFA
ncbi:MAG: ATP-binding cassette domain-containing protein [Betaproteobacteria bacterium]|nr:ATP-binding cassette domain-containing protein [Betaproteobacteria bacterium]